MEKDMSERVAPPDERRVALRKAMVADVLAMHELINAWADQGAMLHRSLAELYENLRDFTVIENEDVVVACCALHINWHDLAEIRSLAVRKDAQGRGFGAMLVRGCIEEARGLGLASVYALTREPEFFEKLGFGRREVADLPRKVWGECIYCPKFVNCDEVALVYKIGERKPGPAEVPDPRPGWKRR